MTRTSFRPAAGKLSSRIGPHLGSNRALHQVDAGTGALPAEPKGAVLLSGAPESNRYDEAGDLACCLSTSAPRGADGGSRTRDPGVALRCVATNTSPALIEDRRRADESALHTSKAPAQRAGSCSGRGRTLQQVGLEGVEPSPTG